MEYYEAYLDEDLYDDYGEGYDEDYDEDYDEANEDGEGFSEAGGRERRTANRTARRGRRADRKAARKSRRNPPAKKGQPASTGAVQNAFDNVGQDIAKTKNQLKDSKSQLATQGMLQTIASFLLAPQLLRATPKIYTLDEKKNLVKTDFIIRFEDGAGRTIIDGTGNPITQVGYSLENNALPTAAVGVLSNMESIKENKGLLKYASLAPLALSKTATDTLLGKNNDNSLSNSAVGNLIKSPAFILIALFLIMNKPK